MLKKYSIIFLFFVAYSVVMAHSIIPHHHHNEAGTEQGDNEHHDDNDHHDDDNDGILAKSFSHFQHTGTSKDILIVSNGTDYNNIVKDNFVKQFLPILLCYFQIFSTPASNDFAEQVFFEPSKIKGSSRSLRAPPIVC